MSNVKFFFIYFFFHQPYHVIDYQRHLYGGKIINFKLDKKKMHLKLGFIHESDKH